MDTTDSKINSDGEVTFSYAGVPGGAYTRAVRRTTSGVQVWSETWGRWTDLRTILARPTIQGVHFTWKAAS